MVRRFIFTSVSLLVAVSVFIGAQASRTVQDGVYTNAQADRGQAIYAKRCASCHGNTLGGGQAPPLVGDGFVGNWRTEPLATLVDKIRHTMPADAPGDLTAAQSTDIVAYVLKTGGFRAGNTELASTEEALKAVTWPAKPPDTASASAQTKAYPPLGNMGALAAHFVTPSPCRPNR